MHKIYAKLIMKVASNLFLKWLTFGVGVWLILAKEANQQTLIAFAGLLLLSFWEDLQEFDFLGLKGKKLEKKLEELSKSVNKEEKPTNEDMLGKLKKKSIQLLGVDKSNFLALVFEIERLLRIIAEGLGIKTGEFTQTVAALEQKEYLTESGKTQIEALDEIRNLIVKSGMEGLESLKLDGWIELAYEVYKEIYDDLSAKT